ncbi:hypothetical protein V0M98_23990 [Pseudomonas silesiensis]|uniref:Lipoprotein n=1 Tax=Pseudomonas silesiensis TaxID=1853130 RepID=A0A191Z0J4_9PSED|nr:hypothetical protein [Pseudomonas silesiensis]ANJ58498.1 hypothetical protein PMA3_26430 [Pseudomonas silesiensis]
MKTTAMVSVAILVGCSNTTTDDVFNTGKVNYNEVNSKNSVTRAETRVFVKYGSQCDYRSINPEGSVVVLAIASFVVNQATEYFSQYMTDKANYLKGDVSLYGKSLIILSKDNYWPTDKNLTLAQKARTARSEALQNSYEEFMLSQQKKPGENESTYQDRAKKYATEKADIIGKAAEKSANVELKNSANDLCILLVAGKYKPGVAKAESDKLLNVFATENEAFASRITNYSSPLPMVDEQITPRPFDELTEDPSMVLEMHVVATEKADNVLYTVIPTNLFYPYPLHKGTANGLERKLLIKTKLGVHEPTITMDHLKSGAVYGAHQLSRNYVQFEEEKTKRFQEVTLTVTEGPDKMPTAKALEAAADSKDKVNTYLIEKLTEKIMPVKNDSSGS